MLIQSDQNNQSVQTVKPSTIFSPGDTILRKNDNVSANQKNPNWDKQSPTLRQKLFYNSEFSTTSLRTHDLYSNMRKQLEKQRSLQQLFNTTQRIGTQLTNKLPTQQLKTSRSNQQLITTSAMDTNRAVIRRGAKFQTSNNSNNQSYHQQNNSSMLNNSNRVVSNKQQQVFMFKNNLSSLTRNKSAYLNFNSTQPLSSKNNKTEIDLRMEDKHSIQLVKNKIIHNQSPSISSEEDKEFIQDEQKIKDFNVILDKQNTKIEVKKPIFSNQMSSHQKKRSQLPNGSFIETKMKNCLQSRNIEQQNAYLTQNYSSSQNQKAVLTKNQSQPSLYQHKNNMNYTQRTTFVKTSFLRHEDSRAITPLNGGHASKSPHGQSTRGDDKTSTNSRTKQIQGLKGDLKSLNLSPIIPQNLGKNPNKFQRETSHSDYNRKNAGSTQKKLEMRKQSASSNVNTKTFNSLKKDRSIQDIQKQVNLRDEPTTEKKGNKKENINIQTMKYQKPGYSSQETERGPGATNSYSTADEFNLISNESQSNYILRFKNEGSQGRKMFLKEPPKQYKSQFTEAINIQDESQIQYKPIIDKNQESKIKVNQILNNNNLSQNQNRYKLEINTDEETVPMQTNPIVVINNKTPRALPYLNQENLNFNFGSNSNVKTLVPKDDDKTLKKHQFDKDSSFDEEEELPDAKDFEEFAISDNEHNDNTNKNAVAKSHNSMKVKVQLIEQNGLFKENKHQNNFLQNYNTAASFLGNTNLNTYYPRDDRNSLVNYDTSLLTHNTGRGDNSSPISDIRDTKKHKQAKGPGKNKAQDYSSILQDNNSFIFPPVKQDQNDQNYQQQNQNNNHFHHKDKYTLNTKSDDGYCTMGGNKVQDNELFSRLLSQEDEEQDNFSVHYKKVMMEIQKQEEKEIEKATQQIFQSQPYKQIKSDKERAKYLSQQISVIRNKYKKILIEKVLCQQ
ncbi:UNKNOWN [Stylonychia lemnae]|uniref:Uncharacterized protein n=1 Tax=Stylonychia lemnae TaxID=5949 RepID=A0A078AGM5_STYLE|nr:UNKNOWN [Stylonychia lemnae]|eukprot:CDW80008.1 UNKNOWN [Stylonychia lemnae]